MKHSKEQVIEVAIKVLEDCDYDFEVDTFDPRKITDSKDLDCGVREGWKVLVKCEHLTSDYWKGNRIVLIDDKDLNPYCLIDIVGPRVSKWAYFILFSFEWK